MSDNEENNSEENNSEAVQPELKIVGIMNPRFTPPSVAQKLFRIGNRRMKLSEIKEYSVGTANLLAYVDKKNKTDVIILAERVRYLELRTQIRTMYYFFEKVEFELPVDRYCGIKPDGDVIYPVDSFLEDFDKTVADLDKYFL